jgi:hypothetical protein
MLNAALFAFALLASPPAQAEPSPGLPDVSLGSNPYRSVSGVFLSVSGTRDLVDIPEGQDFIITAYREGGDLAVLRGDTVILPSPPFYRTYVEEGLARMRVEGGATLRIRRTDTWSHSVYYLQGYFVKSGGPDRFVAGETPGGGSHPIWTSEPDRDFIVRTLFVTTSACDFHLDGVSVSHGSFPFDHVGSKALGKGLGAFVISAGSTLTVAHSTPGEPCEYFIEGHYVQP